MKRILLLFGLFFLFFVPFVSAQEATQNSSESAVVNSDTGYDSYTLPYPGLLPDNPLYTLKALRDRIVGMMISSPEKKAEFDLLQSDKRLQAGVMLIEQSKKYELAQQTISKGENYFEEAIGKTLEAKKQGLDTGSVQDSLKKSALKHVSVIKELLKKVPAQYKAGYTAVLKHAQASEQQTAAIN